MKRTTRSIHQDGPANTGLDAIRALAILLVVAWHWQGYIGDRTLHSGFGPFGVTIFFVLSGYLITSLLLTEYQNTGTISLGRFYRSRALRIFPVFYICWGINSALIVFHGVHLSTWEWLASAFYLMDYARATAPSAAIHNVGIAWSLAIEEQFYLVWPIALFAVLNRGWNAASFACCAIGAVWIYRTALIVNSLATPTYVYNAFDTRIDALLAGCALAILLPRMRRWRVASCPWLVALPVCLLVAIVANDSWAWRTPWRSAGVYIVEPVLVAAVMLYVVENDATRWKFLGNRAFKFIASISYSLYLVHGIAADESARLNRHQALVAVLPALFLPLIFRLYIEGPILALRHSLDRQDLAATAATAVEKNYAL